QYRVESGPKGMKVSGAGLLTWDVPPDLAESEIDVILALGDRSGQEIFHSFRVFSDVPSAGLAPVAQDASPEPEKQAEPAAHAAVPPLRPSPVVRPPQLSADKVVKKLSSPIADVAVGGGGRYLVLYLPQEHKLAVFDVSEAKITGFVPMPGDNVKF